MDENLRSKLIKIIHNSEYADFCLTDIYNVLSRYLMNHSFTISDLGDVFTCLGELIEEEMGSILENMK